MEENYRMECKVCLMTFDSEQNPICPNCGSDDLRELHRIDDDEQDVWAFDEDEDF